MKSFFDGREYHCFQTRPGPRPGSRVLTGSPGRPGQFFFFKSKQCRFSKKQNKSQRVATGFLTRSTGSPGQPTGFFLPLFFLQPSLILAPGGRVPGRPAGLDQVSKLWGILLQAGYRPEQKLGHHSLFMYEIQIITIVFDIKSNWFGDDKRNKKRRMRESKEIQT
jgi:hypothetical protein